VRDPARERAHPLDQLHAIQPRSVTAPKQWVIGSWHRGALPVPSLELL
jgi:hypothetical protein